MILKHRDRELLRFDWREPEGVRIVSVNDAERKFLPLEMKGEATDESLWRWIARRTVPRGRRFIQAALTKLGINPRQISRIVDFSRGLSLNDVYWMVDDSFDGAWKDYNLYDNEFSADVAVLALTGGGYPPLEKHTSTPEFSTNGMLRKCWRRVDGRIELYKGGTEGAINANYEPYSEYYAAQVAAALGLSHVDYGLSRYKECLCSTCPLFTSDKYSYVPAGRLVEVEEALADERFRNIFFFDALILNTDRHLGNFGYLVDNDTNEIVGAAFHRVWGRPMCMSESNYCGPNEYRSMGGLIRGGLAVAQDWTGVWTFAYAHGKKKALNDRVAPPGRFDLALDPIMQATDRLAILIFLRGDLPTPLAAYANVFDAEAMDPVNVHPLSAAPGWAKCHLEWRARMGAAFGNCVPDGVQAVKAFPFTETPPGDPASIGITPDYEKGEFTVASERLVAGFRHGGGVIAAGALIAKVGGSPHATVAVASLDGRSIRDSRRLLLWHLTDVLGDGIVFKDESRREILGSGSPNLIVREGFAKAALSVTNPEGLSVFALDSKGRRVRKVNTSVRQGKLIFTMSVDASAPASIYYEVTSGTVREGVMSR